MPGFLKVNQKEELEKAEKAKQREKETREAIEFYIQLLEFQRFEVTAARERSEAKLATMNQNLQEVMKSLHRFHCSEQRRRYAILREKAPDVYEAMLWLQENEDLFENKIYEPICTLMDIPDPRSVKYIENHVAYNDLTSFFSEDPDDMNNFLRILFDEKGLEINGIYLASASENHFQPLLSKDRLKNFGLTDYLDDLFSAPPPVMNFLIKKYRLHDIPVGHQYSKELIKNVVGNKDFPFTKFYLGDFMYHVTSSKYGGGMSLTSHKIGDPDLLRSNANVAEIEALEQNRKMIESSIRDEEERCLPLSRHEADLCAQVENLRVQQASFSASTK